MSSNAVRTLVVDPSSFVRQGVRRCLEEGGYPILGEAENLDEALELVYALQPNLSVLGAGWDEMALAVARALKPRASQMKLILLSPLWADELFQVDAAASGIDALMQHTDSHQACWAILKEVLAGRILFPREILAAAFQPLELGERERAVLKLWAEGQADNAIAEELGITRNTARTHARNILRKLQVHDRPTAVRRARRRGLM